MLSKYQSYRDRLVTPPDVPIPVSELDSFDWFNYQSTAPEKVAMPDHISVINVGVETTDQRKLRMLKQLSLTCTACSMCELGLKGAEKNSEVRDPHVFSSMTPSRCMVVGQNPGWNEVKQQIPFVGAAGKNFDQEIQKHGVGRDAFYITNTVRCYTADNQRPTLRHVERCEPFLRMEIGLLKPKLVVALGAVAFAQLCPEAEFGTSLKTITKSQKFGIPVFAVYHPSPLNLTDKHRKQEFASQITILCAMVKRLDRS